MENMRWYVIRCSSGQERKAKKHIEDKIIKMNLNDNVSKLVIPTRSEFYIRNGKKVSKEVNFYPGYVLIETNMHPEIQHLIKDTKGVINILGDKDKKGKDIPSPLRQDEVDKILGKIDEYTAKSVNKCEFILGESITISDGPFTNFNGNIEDINEDKKRLKVSIKIFGRKTPVELDFNQVIKN